MIYLVLKVSTNEHKAFNHTLANNVTRGFRRAADKHSSRPHLFSLMRPSPDEFRLAIYHPELPQVATRQQKNLVLRLEAHLAFPRQRTRRNHSGRAFQRRRSSARLREQLREYFEVRFRTEKYGVPYFLAESEAKQCGPRKEAIGARARSGRGFKWKVPRERARRGRRPFKPQTALLHRRPSVGSE